MNDYVCDKCGKDCMTALGLSKHKSGKKCPGNQQQQQQTNNNSNNENNGGCLHSWRNLNGHVPNEYAAIQHGFSEVCRKCKEVQ